MKRVFIAAIVAVNFSAIIATAEEDFSCSLCDEYISGTIDEWRCLSINIDHYLELSENIGPTILLMESPCSQKLEDSPRYLTEPHIGNPASIPEINDGARPYIFSRRQIECLAQNIPAITSRNQSPIHFYFSSCGNDASAK